MPIRAEANRQNHGRTINSAKSAAQSAFNQLDMLKTQTETLLNSIPGDPDLTPADAPDIQAVLDFIDNRFT